jgi:hypothetical protein
VRVLLIVLTALCAPSPLTAQTNDVGWTSFLQGEVRDEVEAAIDVLEADWAEQPERRREALRELRELYATARDEELSWREYTEALRESELFRRWGGVSEPGLEGEAGAVQDTDAGTPAQPGPVDAARAVVAGAFVEQLPIPGTRSFRGAEEWLSMLARREGFPVDRFADAVRGIREAASASLSVSESAAFADAIPVPRESLPGNLSQEDQLQEMIAMWRLRVLAAEDASRIELLRAMRDALSGGLLEADSEPMTALRAVEAERERLLEVRRRLPLPPAVFAALGAHAFGTADAASDRADALERLAAVLSAVAASPYETSVDLYRRDPQLAFLVDTAEGLFGSMSDLQRYELGRAIGLSLDEVVRLRVELHRLRVRAVRLPEELRAREVEPPTEDSAFTDFIAEGTEFVADARPWAEGERSRAGDAYRWAMLAIMSHPYAQYLVGTVPAHEETKSMVEAFSAQTYEDAMRRPGVSGIDMTPIVIGDAIQPFQRVYRVRSARAIEAFYEAFAIAGQGVEELSRDFSNRYAAGLTVAGYWSHTHGLHIVVEPSDGVAGRVRARVDQWFALARAASLVDDEISLMLRGLLSVRRTLGDEMQPLIAASGITAVDAYEPRLSAALGLLDEAATFTVDPRDVMSELARLYGASGDETIDRIASDLETFVARLRDVEIPDRRVLDQLAVGAEEE